DLPGHRPAAAGELRTGPRRAPGGASARRRPGRGRGGRGTRRRRPAGAGLDPGGRAGPGPGRGPARFAAPGRTEVGDGRMNAPVLILAGGTGGHIFPGLAVAEALRARQVPVVWLGARGAMETRLVPAAGIELDTIDVAGLRGKGALTLLLAPLRLLRALWQALAVLRRRRPRAVLSFGGYAAGPGGLGAWLLRRPLLVHEQNRAPGFTNRVLARLARRVMCGFPGSFPGRASEDVGNPVRPAIAALPMPAQRLAGREGPARPLVLGGSQGAAALNRGLPEAIARLPGAARPQLRHQCGERHADAARAAYAAAGVAASVEPFIADMAEAYAWADLVVCRAGALTLAELCAAGVGAVLVPFPAA